MNTNAVGGERPTFGTGWERQEKELNSDIKEQVKVLEKINTLEAG